MEKKLAKITKASLEIQERGILNFWIHVTYEDGLCQGVGGMVLDSYDTVEKKRVGSAYGCEMIRRLLLCIGVNDFSEMVGKHVWIHGEGENFSFKPTGIEMLHIDQPSSKPFIFSEVAKQFGL